MKKTFFLYLFILFSVNDISAQDKKAEMVLDIGNEQCSYFINIVPVAFNKFHQTPDSKIYVIYYEGKYRSSVWNKKSKQNKTVFLNPRRGNALNRAKEVELFLKEYNFSKDSLVLIDGGFRELLTLEFWIVPNGVEPPKPTPTVDEKDVKFEKGKPFSSRECARIYDGL